MSAPKALFVSSNRIGDCVISSGVIREIARQLPGVQITVACGRPPAPFFRSAPNVERVITLDKKKAAGHWVDLWKQVRGTKWDLVVDIRGSALAWLIPARRRVVYSRRWETGLRKVEMVSRLMGSAAPLDPEIFLDDQARAEAAAIIDPQLAAGPGEGPIIALAPIAHQPGKSWPADRWGALVEKLKAEPRFDGANPFVGRSGTCTAFSHVALPVGCLTASERPHGRSRPDEFGGNAASSSAAPCLSPKIRAEASAWGDRFSQIKGEIRGDDLIQINETISLSV